ncbi:MAG: chitobiase/beta-hexosaminidase C-terminal domain-containing protein, partial [Chitinophagaceae bacterium]|nr:chitobiase/beta-hexosaminidase C-terminal domain-containing protein [Chitinophagaceae bacterium]
VKLTHPLKGVEIRYTLDRSEPDSVKSPVYKEPFTLNSFTVIKAKAFKPKWYGSKTLSAAYFMKGAMPDSVSLVSDEGDNRGRGKVLFDQETGDMNVGSGKWISFRKPVSCYMFFNEPVSVHNLSVNMFVDVKFKMFLPEKMDIWGGMDKNSMKLMKSWKSDPPAKDSEAVQMQPSIGFKETKVKCIELIMQPWVIKKTDVQSFISEIVVQ